MKEKYTELNKNKSTTHQSLWNMAKALMRVIYSIKCIHRKKEKSPINNLAFHLKNPPPPQKKLNIPTSSRGKEIIKIWPDINDNEKRKTRKTNEIKSQFSEKSNKINKPLARMTKQNKRNNPRRHKLPISGMKQGESLYNYRHQKDHSRT